MTDIESKGKEEGCRTELCRRAFMCGLGSVAVLPFVSGCINVRRHIVELTERKDATVFVSFAKLAKLKDLSDVLEIRVEGNSFPILLRRTGKNAYLALSSECTHRSCELEPTPRSYDCPCHGSRFDLKGKVLAGPADRPLEQFPLTLTPKGMVISLSANG